MMEPLFASNPGVWTGQLWPSPQASMLGAPPGLAPPPSPANSAPMLVAAVALNRGQPHGPTTDQEVEEVIYDALELFSGANDVEVRCESGRLTLSGTVWRKHLKRDIGEIGWAIPAINDVQNNIAITPRRRARAFSREAETQPAAASRKQA
jgi:BON domain-containing protein